MSAIPVDLQTGRTDRITDLLAGIEANEAKLEAKLETTLSELIPITDTRQLTDKMLSEVRNTVRNY